MDGGFMPSQISQQPGQSPSKIRSGGSGAQPTLRALTIKQLATGAHDSFGGQWEIDGMEVSNVVLVGKITQSQERSSCLEFQLDDGSGMITAKTYADGTEDADSVAQRPESQVGQYVRVCGSLKIFDNSVTVQAYSTRLVRDANEITYHFLQCIFQHQHLSKKAAAGHAGGGVGAMGGGSMAPAYQPAAGMNGVDADMTPVQREVKRIFDAPNALASANGLNINDVAVQLKSRYNPNQVKQAAEFLANEGHLYTTHDDLHFKSTAQ